MAHVVKAMVNSLYQPSHTLAHPKDTGGTGGQAIIFLPPRFWERERRRNKGKKKEKALPMQSTERGQVYIYSQAIPCGNRNQRWERAGGRQSPGRAGTGTGQMEQVVQPHSFS